MFNLQFPLSDIRKYAALYVEEQSKRDRILTKQIENDVFPSYRMKRYLTKQEFLIVCNWKTPRPKHHYESNDEEYIKDISALVMQTSSERLRIETWTLLSGVKWPTASVFLHFGFPDNYPILDFRALESLGVEKDSVKFNFYLWDKYCQTCKRIAREAGVTMRVLDQALWKYSKDNPQKKSCNDD